MSDDTKPQFGSFDPEFFSAGGFFDDRDATIVSAEIVEFDYRGQAEPACFLAVTFRPDESEAGDADDDRVEYYRIGDLSKFTPSQDRQRYVPVGSATSMNKGTKAALFLMALKAAGFDLNQLAEGIGKMGGLHVHVNSVPMPEFKGKDREGFQGKEKKKDSTVLVVTVIHDAPAPNMATNKAGGKTTAAKVKAAVKPKPEAAAAAAAPANATQTAETGSAASGAGSDAEDRAAQIILELIAEKGGKVAKGQIPPAMFAKIPSSESKLRNQAIGLVGNTAWLSSGDRPWSYNGGELSLG